ncbi:hypothetical protein GCM10009113_32620 [Marinobacter szutsaonensis]
MEKVIRLFRNFGLGMLMVLPVTGYAAPGTLADQPLYLGGGRGVPANLVLTPSVEYPTIQSLANLGDYNPSENYEGYFDPQKCYRYNHGEEENRHFYPTSVSTSKNCTGSGEWSGNFLNWATTQTIDPFRKALTGGYRYRDTPTETWLEKARHPGQSSLEIKEISGQDVVRSATPFDAANVKVKIEGLGVDMRFSLGDTSVDAEEVTFDPDNFPASRPAGETEEQYPVSEGNGFSYRATVRVKVCDSNVGLEGNCVQYSQGWKPEGLIQANADTLRYSVFGYLNDNSSDRDGGVLRARQKYVGPEMFSPTQGQTANPNAEWDSVTGVLVQNPDPNDADGFSLLNSGVINYINKFGQLNDNEHKVLDPVSELYYAATRYLKGQSNVSAYSDIDRQNADYVNRVVDGFPVIASWTDPVQYECQPSVILGIGDANTHDDKNLPGNTAYLNDEPSKPSEVSDDDTVNVVTATNRVGVIEFQGANDTLGETNSFTGRDNSAYIAGLAFDNHVNDMRSDLPGKQTATTFWVDVMENQRLEAPESNQYYLAAKYGGFEVPEDFDADSRTDPLPEDWWSVNGDTLTATNGTTFQRPDNYYTAGNASDMIEGMKGAFKSAVASAVGSSTGVTFNTATIETDTLLFGAEFKPSNWTGELYAVGLTENDSGPPTVSDSATWEAGSVLDARDLSNSPRNIFTYNGSTGVNLTSSNWSSFTQDFRDDFGFDGTGSANSTIGAKRISYFQGNSVEGYRVRASLLADIVNSTPVYVGEPNMAWPNAEPFGILTDTYADFRAAKINRAPVVYVGANDGMLHAFSAANGSELFGYIPEFIASGDDDQGLHYLTDPDYQHRYYVDLSPVVSDVYIEGANGGVEDWRTVLIGGARTGGKGIFALDITDPSTFGSGAANIPLWEFSSDDDSRMGYITEPPTIGLAYWDKNDSPKWTAFVPNGYNSSTQSTGVFLLDLEGGLDGTWTEDTDYQYIEFESAGDGATGLSPVRQLDLDGDRLIDRIYAGDLKGNIWSARYNSGGPSGWEASLGGAPLFTAERTDTSGAMIAQPVTAAPMVVRNPDKESGNPLPDLLVLFGTGQYLTQDDPISTSVQSFYGVLDTSTANLDRSDLVGRTLDESTVTGEDGVSYKVRESEGDTFDTQHGWYVDFNTESEAGERITQSPQVRGEYVFVNSIVPTSNPCDIGGDGWIMAFGLDGRSPDRAVWPKLGEGIVGYKTEGGLPNPGSFLGDYVLIPRSDSEILSDEVDVGRNTGGLGRVGWQELYN